MREFTLLQHIFSANPTLVPRVIVPPGDDMGMITLVEAPGTVLAAVDQLIDGRHVRLDTTPIELAGRKAITRSLSDIAAMGAKPLATLAAATLPPNFGESRAKQLFDAMRQTADQYQCPLIGGDVAFHRDAAYPLVCSITVLAEAVGGRVALRSAARPGHGIYVTGSLGGSLQADGLGRHLTFEPRIREGMHIVKTLGEHMGAMIDLSDGLGRDASHIAEMSNVRIILESDLLPTNHGCNWRRALSDGEDYELCFTAAGGVPSEALGVKITRVGHVVATDDSTPAHRVSIRSAGQLLDAGTFGWEHASSP